MEFGWDNPGEIKKMVITVRYNIFQSIHFNNHIIPNFFLPLIRSFKI